MGAVMRIIKFGLGGVVGFVGGAVAGLLAAPRSGEETIEAIEARLREAEAAGDAARIAKERELIARYRGVVGDPNALGDEERRLTSETGNAMRAVGLGLNAPGALSAHAASDNDGRAGPPPS